MPSQAVNPPRSSPVGIVILAAFLIVATVFGSVALRNNARKIKHGERGSKDYPLWFETGQRVLHGQSPYFKDWKNEYPFMYPPAAAALLAPVTVAGKLPLVALQVTINTLGWAVAILVPVYLLTGRVRPSAIARDPVALLFWVPSLICVFYIWGTYLEGQPAFLLSSILLVMFLCLRRRIAWGAGFALALAAGLKGFPILALPYLLWRREWKAVAWTAGFLVVLLLALPAMFRGPHGAWDDLNAWRINMAGQQTPDIIGQRAQRSYTWQNGSVTSVVHRWLRPVVADNDEEYRSPLTVNVADVPFATIQHIVLAITAAFGLGYVLVMPWRDRDRTPFTDTVEAAMLLILIVLFSPLSFTYNQSWLMLGLAAVLWFAMARARTPAQRAVALVWLAIAVVPLVFTVRVPAFRDLRARGNTCFADVALLIELAWILVVERTRPHDGADCVTEERA